MELLKSIKTSKFGEKNFEKKFEAKLLALYIFSIRKISSES